MRLPKDDFMAFAENKQNELVNMQTSKLLPTDRPSRAYCYVCEEYLTEDFTFKGKNVKPINLSGLVHTKCGVSDSTVYVFRDKPSVIPGIANLPHCGDPNCQGYCDDLACIPQTQPALAENNSIKKENIVAAAIVIFFITLAVFARLSN
jgi:hypothetical protein